MFDGSVSDRNVKISLNWCSIILFLKQKQQQQPFKYVFLYLRPYEGKTTQWETFTVLYIIPTWTSFKRFTHLNIAKLINKILSSNVLLMYYRISAWPTIHFQSIKVCRVYSWYWSMCPGRLQCSGQMEYISDTYYLIIEPIFPCFCVHVTKGDNSFWSFSNIKRERCGQQPQNAVHVIPLCISASLMCLHLKCWFCHWQAQIVITSVWQYYGEGVRSFLFVVLKPPDSIYRNANFNTQLDTIHLCH